MLVDFNWDAKQMIMHLVNCLPCKTPRTKIKEQIHLRPLKHENTYC